MVTLTEFLLARIAEDEAGNGCNGEGEYTTCWQRSKRIERECDAKRRIVELHAPNAPLCMWSHDSMECHDDYVCDTLRALALPYADHPDYREEWRP